MTTKEKLRPKKNNKESKEAIIKNKNNWCRLDPSLFNSR
jgi:hypothetical protein